MIPLARAIVGYSGMGCRAHDGLVMSEGFTRAGGGPGRGGSGTMTGGAVCVAPGLGFGPVCCAGAGPAMISDRAATERAHRPHRL